MLDESIIDFYSTLRILINSHRLPGESSEDLANRILADSNIFTTLVNSEPSYSNASLLKALLCNPDFVRTL